MVTSKPNKLVTWYGILYTCLVPAASLFSQVSLSHLRQCLSPETSVTERSSATKRPAGEEEEGGDEEEIVEGPKKKISFGLSKPKGTAGLVMPAKKPLAAISIKLGQAQKAPVQPVVKPKVGAAASVFSAEDDENSEEEMPPEAKMRMKNIGRDTPTSAGPNSFGKTRMGFCDSKKIYEKQLP